MRHALAPGGGDPPGFRLGVCSTQRNLSDAGRRQARAIGVQLRAAGIRPGLVAASQWCRCTQTAQLLDLGAVTPWPSLNSFFGNAALGPGQTAKTLARLQDLRPNLRPLLVTHQVNIRSLTGQNTRSGEIIVARKTPTGGLQAVGAIAPPQAA
jgi:phosphohistidine phosphatase SixA